MYYCHFCKYVACSSQFFFKAKSYTVKSGFFVPFIFFNGYNYRRFNYDINNKIYHYLLTKQQLLPYKTVLSNPYRYKFSS